MSYRALYRVWRPQRFDDVVGQEHVTQTLKNALREGHLSHAYLFHGPRGSGKTSAAKILAKAVNCLNGPAPEPCNDCEICKRITEGSVMDVIEIDAASNRGVDEIRELRDKVKYAPSEVRYKVYIIDEVHMLTTEAFNALLKTLEEPPGHVIFILATTEPHKLPPTIISRCQRFSFRRHTAEQIVGRLRFVLESMNVNHEERALWAVAKAADGGMRDALSLLDQALAYAGETLDEESVLSVTGAADGRMVVELFRTVMAGKTADALQRLNDCFREGMEPDRLVDEWIRLVRDLLLYKAAPGLEDLKMSLSMYGDLPELAETLSIGRLSGIIDQLSQTARQMKWSTHPRFLLEAAIIRMTGSDGGEAPIASSEWARLEARVRELEQKLARLQEGQGFQSGPGKTAESPAKPVRTSELRDSGGSVALEQWVRETVPARLAEIRKAWPEILHRVKEEKIMVHAWLVDGEPVGATPDSVIVGFKSKIHRETTEKQAHKELIQRVLSQVTGQPLKLRTVMTADWKRVASRRASESDEGSADEEESSADVVKRAVELFGEQLVKVMDT
nr:DNA polymerase III subunit gamma/tau [Staphylospora marina]